MPAHRSPAVAANIAAYGTYVSTRNARRVWAAVTQQPQATVRELAGELSLTYSVVAAALRMLKFANYIEFEPGAARARRVIIPFVIIGKEST